MTPKQLVRRVLSLSVAATVGGTVLLALPASAATAAITSVAPSSATNNSTSPTTLTFTTAGSFVSGATVKLTSGSFTIDSTAPGTTSADMKTLSAVFAFSGEAPGFYTASITNPGSSAPDFTCPSACFQVTGRTPTVAGIARTSGTTAPSPSSFDVTGTGFAKGSTVSVSGTGVTVGATTVSSATKLVTTLDTAGSTGGLYDLTVTNSDGTSRTLVNAFDVPKVSSVALKNLAYGVQNETLHLTGNGFTSATRVSFLPQSGTSVITVTDTHLVSTSALDVVVNVADPTSNVPTSDPAAVAQTYDVLAQDAGDGYSVLPGGLVLDPRPKPDTTKPYHFDNPGQGSSLTEVVTGTGFHSGMTVAFSPATGLTVGPVVVTGGGTTATFPLTVAAGAPLTGRTLLLTNPDDKGTNLSGGKALTPSAAPAVTSASPSAVNKGTTSVALTVNGSGIGQQPIGTDGAAASKTTNYVTPQITVDFPAPASANATPSSDGTSASTSGTIAVPANASGSYDVEYLDHNGSVVVCSKCFHVDALSVASVTPTTGNNDATRTITATGSTFASGAALVLQRAGQPDIVATGVTTAPTTVSGTVDLTGAAPGAWTVRVTNPDGTTGKLADGFTVTGAQPTITSLSPTSLAAGSKDAALVVNGTDLARGATLVLTCLPGSTCPKALPQSEWTSLQKMTFHLDTTGASTGQVSVQVKNTDNATSPATCLNACTFTVTPAPSLSQAAPVSPASRAAGAAPFTMTITGSGLVSGATVTVDGSGVTAGPATVTNNQAGVSTVTATVTVTSGAERTARSVTVENPDHSTASCSACFTVIPAPTVSSISPSTQKVGTGPTQVTITGTGFNTQGAAVSFSGTGVTAGTAVVTSATSITLPVTVDAAAAHTPRTVTVTNTPAADGGVGTLANAFTPVTVPTAPTGLTASRSNGSVVLSWTAPSDDGGTPVTGYTVTTTKHSDGTAPTPAPTTTVSGRTATVSGLSNGTAYDFVVAATNAVGTGPSSSAVTATPATVPSQVTGAIASAGAASATVAWNPPSNGGDPITSYTIHVLPSDASESPSDRTATSSPSTVTGLVNGHSYRFTVAATNGVGTGTPSDATSPVTPQVASAGTPTNLLASAAAAAGQVDLTWNAPSGQAPTSYVVTVTPSSGSNTGTTTYPATRTTPSAKVTGLTNGVSCSFTVHAVFSGGTTSPESAPATATPYTVPGAVSSLTTAPGDKQASASWSPPTDNGGRAVTSYTATLSPGGASQTVTGTTATFTGLTNGTTYTIAVVATNARGNGPSSSATVTPAVGASPSPTGTASPTATPTATASATPTGSTSASPSATPTKAASSVTLADSASVVARGQHIVLSGRVTRGNSGPAFGSVVLRARDDSGAVRVVTTLVPASDGSYRYDFAPVHNASYGATYGGDAGNAASGSAVRRTLVACRVSASAPTGAATASQVIRGSVLPNKAGQVVTLYRVRSDGTLVRLATARLSSNSTYQFVVRLSKGNHLLQVGIADTAGNRHGAVRFVAKRT